MKLDARSGWILLGLALAAVGCDGPPPPIQERASLVGHAREVSSLAFAPDGKTLASRGGDAVRLWDLAGLKEVASFPGDGSAMGSVAISPDGAEVAATVPGVGVVAWDLATHQPVVTYRSPERTIGEPASPSNPGRGLAYSPDGKRLASGLVGPTEGGLVFWDREDGKATGLAASDGPITSVAISPDGRTLAAKGLGDSIHLWRFSEPGGTGRRAIRAGRSYGAPIVFSPDSGTIASADDDRRVKLYDLATGREVANLKWHLRAVLSAAFHPGGKLLASGDSNGVILLWDLATRAPIGRFEGPQGKVWALAFSPDGKTLAAAGEDKVVRLWDVPSR